MEVPSAARRNYMNSDFSIDVEHAANSPRTELELSQSMLAETRSIAIPERHCEMFEGGLGI
jgi:hypothetical protein